MPKKTNSVFEIKNSHLILLTRFLNTLSVSGKESRERTRFIQSITPRLQEIENGRMSLIEKLGKKNNEGKLIKDENNSYKFSKEKRKQFQEEMTAYFEETFKLDVLESNSEQFITVRNMILNTDYKFKSRASLDLTPMDMFFAEDYNEWCEAFEATEL